MKNVEFLKGEIEHIPLPDNSVDVIISNCVINLSGDKDGVLNEAFRVLKSRRPLRGVRRRGARRSPRRQSAGAWIYGSAASPGRFLIDEFIDKLANAGFDGIDIEITRVYDADDARAFLAGEGFDNDALVSEVAGKFVSAFIRATKPASCCAPGCCTR